MLSFIYFCTFINTRSWRHRGCIKVDQIIRWYWTAYVCTHAQNNAMCFTLRVVSFISSCIYVDKVYVETKDYVASPDIITIFISAFIAHVFLRVNRELDCFQMSVINVLAAELSFKWDWNSDYDSCLWQTMVLSTLPVSHGWLKGVIKHQFSWLAKYSTEALT